MMLLTQIHHGKPQLMSVRTESGPIPPHGATRRGVVGGTLVGLSSRGAT